MMSMFGSEFLSMGDEGASIEEINASPSGKIHDKIVKALNRDGIYYLWQLKDREGGVVQDNIKDEWKK
jgi:hypothetical protein